ncbi:DUF885 family protein [Bermanella sp. R86510]|uniref:DUF885 family protein n=1 Tax=unclassified Bermanella TaxID=2627862 RepID=UPI0037CB10D6
MTTFTDIEQQFRQHILSDPFTNMELGATDFLGQLGDPSLASEQKHIDQAKALLASIEQTSSEDFDESLDLELMTLDLKRAIFFHELQQHDQPQRRRRPGGVDGISAGIFQLFVNDNRSASARLDNIVSRLQQAPEYLAIERQVVSQPITRWMQVELEQGEGIPDFLDTIYAWAKQENYASLAELENAIDQCKQALTEYLTDISSRPTIDDFSIGEDKVNELLALRQIYKTPSELAQMAKQFMLETQQLLNDLTTKLAAKYDLPSDTNQEQLHTFLNEQFAAPLKNGDLDSILDYYHEQIQGIETFIQKNQLFPLPKQQKMTILKTPSFLEPVIPAGAMWPPLALREGSKDSMVYLTLKHDQLSEHTLLGIPVMMIHEGIPGHHLQLASAALHPSFVRRIFSANEHAEGWTTMLEDYMLDIGYIGDELVDEARFIAKREMTRLVARVGIDLYFMTNNKAYLDMGLELNYDSEDVFENAAKLLKAATGFTDGRVQAELNWYSMEQGYPLSYLTGNRLVWQLKTDIQQANKKQLTPLELDRAFHDVYVNSGCMPVESLRKVFAHYGYL